MSLVDWSKVDEKYKWATGDEDGVWLHVEEPRWHIGLNGYYSDSLETPLPGSHSGLAIKEQRPTNTVDDPPAIIPVIKETLDLLDYLAFEAGQRPSPEDRLKIVDHIRALSKALKEWENY